VLNQASNEIREQRLSSAKARRVLGWKPVFSLDQGLARTIDWYRAFFAEDPPREGRLPFLWGGSP
jgi:CDP-glucose 4,6-dehydratase